jgi:hypothetical protein
VGASEPGDETAAEWAADVGHRRPGKRVGLLEGEVVHLHSVDVPVAPAAHDCLGEHGGVDAELCPGVPGPGAQLHGEVGHKHQLTGLSFGMTGDQLVDQAAGRPGDPG